MAPGNISEAVIHTTSMVLSDGPPVVERRENLTSVLAIKALVSYDGDAAKAAMALGTDEPTLIAAIITDGGAQEIMSRYARAHSLIRTMGLLGSLNTAIESAIVNDEMSAKDMARLMPALLESLNKLTDVRQPIGEGTDPNKILDLVPDNVRGAIQVLLQANQPTLTEEVEPLDDYSE